MADYSIKRVMQRPHLNDIIEPAVMRVPLGHGEFYASWPQLATSTELQAIKGMFAAVIDGWIVAADSRKKLATDANVEYLSWFEKEARHG